MKEHKKIDVRAIEAKAKAKLIKHKGERLENLTQKERDELLEMMLKDLGYL